MTRVDFYILQGMAPDQLQRLACRLVDKAWQRGMKSWVNVPDNEAMTQLDQLLWTFRDISFLPHACCSSTGASPQRLAAVIGCNDEPGVDIPVLINLHPEVPAFFSRFDRVAELVDNDPERREAGRERFRFYRDRGYPVETHNLG